MKTERIGVSATQMIIRAEHAPIDRHHAVINTVKNMLALHSDHPVKTSIS